MKINSNMQALVAQNVLRKNEEKNAASTEKLSSGFKINHAKDSLDISHPALLNRAPGSV